MRRAASDAMAGELNVRYFASLAELTGRTSEVVTLEPGTDVSGLWEQLTRRHPALARLSFRPLVACDLDYAAWDRDLDGVREVGFLPPVSGG